MAMSQMQAKFLANRRKSSTATTQMRPKRVRNVSTKGDGIGQMSVRSNNVTAKDLKTSKDEPQPPIKPINYEIDLPNVLKH